MSADTSKMQAAAIRELCKPLRLPTVAAQAAPLAEQAAKEKQSHICFLEALLSAEVLRFEIRTDCSADLERSVESRVRVAFVSFKIVLIGVAADPAVA